MHTRSLEGFTHVYRCIHAYAPIFMHTYIYSCIHIYTNNIRVYNACIPKFTNAFIHTFLHTYNPYTHTYVHNTTEQCITEQWCVRNMILLVFFSVFTV